MSNVCYLLSQSFYMYFIPSLKIHYTFTCNFQCMPCVLTFAKSATLSMASWSLTIQTYSLPKITKQEGKHHYSWQYSVYLLYKVQNLSIHVACLSITLQCTACTCTFSELKKNASPFQCYLKILHSPHVRTAEAVI